MSVQDGLRYTGISMGSLSHSLFVRLISFDPTTFSKAIDGVDGAQDGKQNPGVGYSDAVEIRAHVFDKL